MIFETLAMIGEVAEDTGRAVVIAFEAVRQWLDSPATPQAWALGLAAPVLLVLLVAVGMALYRRHLGDQRHHYRHHVGNPHPSCPTCVKG